MCTVHQPVCAVWADMSIVMDHSSVLKPTLQSVLVWLAPLSHDRAKQGHTKHNCTSSHFATIQRASILNPVALLSQEHKDFSAWFTVCEWLWTGPHAVLWCIVYVCVFGGGPLLCSVFAGSAWCSCKFVCRGRFSQQYSRDNGLWLWGLCCRTAACCMLLHGLVVFYGKGQWVEVHWRRNSFSAMDTH